MTYCLGIRLRSGLVAIADTRLTTGSETSTSKKLYTKTKGANNFFLMTSGLRSIRDKAMTYFESYLEDEMEKEDKIYKAANLFGETLKQVRKEDGESIAKSGLSFNLHAIIGGQFHDDKEHKLYLVYPEGNWVEVTEGAPYVIIGNSGFGNPVLRRTINYDSTIKFALKTGFLSFDSTRVSANDVGYPIDIAVLNIASNKLIEKRFYEEDLSRVSSFWAEKLSEAITLLPDGWTTYLS